MRSHFQRLVLVEDLRRAEEHIARERKEELAQRRELADMAHADAEAREYSSWLAHQCLLRERARRLEADREARAERLLATSAVSGQTAVGQIPCSASPLVHAGDAQGPRPSKSLNLPT